MQLAAAWVASALAGAVAYSIGVLIAAALQGVPSVLWNGFLRFDLYVFAFCLALQLVYGGLLYLVLARLGLISLALILIAYVVPLMLFIWVGSDRPKDLFVAIPMLLCAASLAIVGWTFVRV